MFSHPDLTLCITNQILYLENKVCLFFFSFNFIFQCLEPAKHSLTGLHFQPHVFWFGLVFETKYHCVTQAGLHLSAVLLHAGITSVCRPA